MAGDKYEGITLTFQTVQGKAACFKHDGEDVWLPLSQFFDAGVLRSAKRGQDVFVEVEKWVLKQKGLLE
jgi:hypothetical protein